MGRSDRGCQGCQHLHLIGLHDPSKALYTSTIMLQQHWLYSRKHSGVTVGVTSYIVGREGWKVEKPCLSYHGNCVRGLLQSFIAVQQMFVWPVVAADIAESVSLSTQWVGQVWQLLLNLHGYQCIVTCTLADPRFILSCKHACYWFEPELQLTSEVMLTVCATASKWVKSGKALASNFKGQLTRMLGHLLMHSDRSPADFGAPMDRRMSALAPIVVMICQVFCVGSHCAPLGRFQNSGLTTKHHKNVLKAIQSAG